MINRITKISSIAPAPSHLTLTGSKGRTKIRAVISLAQVRDETPSIKSFQFKVIGVMNDAELDPSYIDPYSTTINTSIDGIRSFRFKSGQWVDFFASQVPVVGGFSITSSPQELLEGHMFELAIKRAYLNPLVRWLHHSARIGNVFQARVGGDFFFEDGISSTSPTGSDSLAKRRSVLLIAGGVGATPMISMATCITGLNRSIAGSASPRKVVALFSAKTASELLFVDRLAEIARDTRSGLELRFRVTQTSEYPNSHVSDMSHDFVQYGRIDRNMVSDCVLACRDSAGGLDPLIYLCGPPAFEKDILHHLNHSNLPSHLIHCEKWW